MEESRKILRNEYIVYFRPGVSNSCEPAAGLHRRRPARGLKAATSGGEHLSSEIEDKF